MFFALSATTLILQLLLDCWDPVLMSKNFLHDIASKPTSGINNFILCNMVLRFEFNV
jgi:hypothetical protein